MESPRLLRLELDAFDFEDLKATLTDSLVSTDQQKPSQAYGEPVTIAVIILGPLAIKALATWLTKQRRRTELFDDIEIETPDGERIRHHLHIRVESRTTEPEVVRQLVDGLNLDPKVISAVASLGK